MGVIDVSIVIPHRGPVLGLWTTIASCHAALGNYSAEFIIHVNGREREPSHGVVEADNVQWIYTKEGLGAALPREIAARKAQGKWIAFLDDHVIVPPNFFSALFWLDKDVMHPCTQCYPDRDTYYHYPLDARADDTDCSIAFSPARDSPYPILSAGHGNWMVRRSTWEAVGGYGEVFNAYNGEEVYFGLRCWMHGLEVWMHPGVKVWHFPHHSEWKNRDESYQERFSGGLRALESLKAKLTLAEAYEKVRRICPT